MLRNMQNMSPVAQKKKAQQHQELIASFCPTQLLARVGRNSIHVVIFFGILLSIAIHKTTMGLLDKLRRKKDETVEKVKEETTPQPTHPTNAEPPPGRRIKRYTSEGKPVYE